MKVEIWSDFACPFCFIGKTHYAHALSKFKHKDSIETFYRSFELSPNEDSSKRVKTVELIAKKYGVTVEKMKQMNQNIVAQAASAGLTFKFDDMIAVNTFDCHRIAVYAQTMGKGDEFTTELFKNYFTDNAIISDEDVLVEAAVKVGLDKDEVLKVLRSTQFSEQVRNEEQEATQLGVRGVPFFVFDRKYAISGAQPEQAFLEVLEKAWSEQSANLINVQGDADACSIDGSNC